jgi:hypothetical protein
MYWYTFGTDITTNRVKLHLWLDRDVHQGPKRTLELNHHGDHPQFEQNVLHTFRLRISCPDIETVFLGSASVTVRGVFDDEKC